MTEAGAFDAMEIRLLPGLKHALWIVQQYWEPDAIVPAFDDIEREIKRIEAIETRVQQARLEDADKSV